MKTVDSLMVLFFGNLAIAAVLQLVEEPTRMVFYGLLGAGDVMSLIYIMSRTMKGGK
jgi:hypothetical protein